MQQYVNNGKNEEDFYFEFIHNVRCDYSKKPTDDGVMDEPYGVIIVPKDYDTDWIAYRNFYLGWKVVVAPVAERFIKTEYQKLDE